LSVSGSSLPSLKLALVVFIRFFTKFFSPNFLAISPEALVKPNISLFAL